MSIAAHSVARFSRALLELYQPTTIEELPERLARILFKLMGNEFACWNRVNLATAEFTAAHAISDFLPCTGFGEEERTLMAMLWPHVLQAVQNAQFLSALERENLALNSASDEKEKPGPLILETELGLTKREAEVLFWVSQGKRNAEIGTILGTTPKTITKHVERIFAKLGVETRTAAANIALQVLGG